MKALKALSLFGLIFGLVALTSLNFSDDPSRSHHPFEMNWFEMNNWFENWQQEMAVQTISAHLEEKNASLPDADIRELARTMYNASRAYSVDYRLVLAIMEAESNFRQEAVSEAGAVGIMQIMPSLARSFAEDVGIPYDPAILRDPHSNVRIGVYYLAWLSRHYDSPYAILHAYNVGFTKAKESLKRNSEPKTFYTRKVMEGYQRNRLSLPEV